MTELLTRLVPGARDIRVSLAVGYSWIALIWTILVVTETTANNDIADFVSRATEELPALAVAAALTFVATMLGSGIVRLMDRLMQLSRPEYGRKWNPLDEPEPFDARPWLPRGPWNRWFGEAWKSSALEECIAELETSHNHILERYGDEFAGLAEWRDVDRRSFRDLLSADAEFGAHHSEQLLRYSMSWPVAAAALVAVPVAISGLARGDFSTAVLLLLLLAFLFFLRLDYRRTGVLLEKRWRLLARNFEGAGHKKEQLEPVDED